MATTTAVAAAPPVPAGGPSGPHASGRQEIAGNFQQFLLLLTTQLKNQSPLDPLDTNQFTQQLVQFASVEQQLKTNETLSALVQGSKAAMASSAAGLVGANVTADGTSATMTEGQVTWTLSPERAAASATITISDSQGQAVATQTRALAAGTQDFAWDGRTSNGARAVVGTYRIAVTARDAAGRPVSVGTDLSGKVTAVDMSGDAPVLLIGQARVPLASIKAIGG